MPQKRMRVWCPLMPPSEHELGERLAARTLELIDLPSESRDEARLAAHVRELLPGRARPRRHRRARRPGRARGCCSAAISTPSRPRATAPGRRDGERVHGLGASDMKGALAVMIELVRDGAPFGALFFGREELPFDESALTPLLARHPLAPELVVMMEPTDNAIHAGCLGNINATWTFHGVAGHSARPWFADNAITRAAAGVTALAAHEPEPHDFDGLEFVEVATGDEDRGRDRHERDPRRGDRARELPLRARPHAGGGRGAAAGAVRGPRRAADRRQRAVAARSRAGRWSTR